LLQFPLVSFILVLQTHLAYFFNPFLLYRTFTVSSFSIFLRIYMQSVGLLGRVIGPSQGLYLNTGKHKHRINARTYQTSMPEVGFELTPTASARAKTVHTLDRSTTMTGSSYGCKTWPLLVDFIGSSDGD
jgi:hypothetical protein